MKFLATALLVLNCSPAHSAEPEKISLQLRWDHQYQFAGYYAAKWQGYYAAEGLEVDIRSAIGRDGKILSGVEEVLAGRADFGIGSGDILLAIDRGAPLVVLAPIFQQSAAEFYAREGTRLNAPADLLKLRVARKVNDLIDIELQAMLLAEGIAPAKLKSYPHQPGIEHLVSGRVDVIPGYSFSAGYELAVRGIKTRKLLPGSYGVDFYGDTLFASSRLTDADPAKAERFLRASLKGWEYALEHPYEIADRITRELPRNAAVIHGDLKAFNRAQVDMVKQLTMYPVMELGHLNRHRLSHMAEFMVKAGVLKSELDLARAVFDPARDELLRKARRNRYIGVAAVSLLCSLLAALAFILLLRGRVAAALKDRDRKEAQRRESEDKYEYIFQHSPIGKSITLPTGELSVNAAFCEMVGYSAGELASRKWQEISHPDDIPATQAALEELLSGRKERVNFVKRYIRKNGSVVWAEVRTALRRDEQGKPLYFMTSVVDITARKAAQNERDRTSGILRSLVENIPLGVFMVEAPSGKPVFANEIACEILGRGILPDATKENLGQVYKAVRLPGGEDYPPEEMPILRGMQGNVSSVSDMAVLRPDGRSTTLEIFGSPVRDEGGRVWASLVVFRDITERKQAEEAARQKAAILEAQLRASIYGVLIVDEKGRKILQNQRSAELWKIPREVAENSDDSAQMAHFLGKVKDPDRFADKIKYLYSHPGETSHDEVELKDGTMLERYSAPVLGEKGENYGRIWTFLDITGQRAAEADREKMRAELAHGQKMESIGRLAGGVAHDFNNLLTAINSYASLVQRALPGDSQLREDVQEIIAAAERAAGLTRQLLAFSRKQMLKPRVMDLNGSVADITKMLKRLIGEDISLEAKFAPECCRVKADPDQISQVLINLAVNGRDAMPKGGTLNLTTALIRPDYSLTSKFNTGGGPMVLLEVRDNGAGMTEEIKEHIFEPFYTTKDKSKGTGLGLATVYGIVKQSDGFIDVQSEPGRGTAFRIYLPYVSESEGGQTVLAPEPDNRKNCNGTETILLVEDEESLRNIGCRILGDCGYTVIAATDSNDAFKAAERHGKPFDLVLCDVVLPGMNGRDLARQLVARKLATKVMYMSGYTEDAIVKHGVLEKGIAFIYKPFTPDGICAKVREVLDGPAENAKA